MSQAAPRHSAQNHGQEACRTISSAWTFESTNFATALDKRVRGGTRRLFSSHVLTKALTPAIIKLKTTHKFVESQAAKAVVGQTIY